MRTRTASSRTAVLLFALFLFAGTVGFVAFLFRPYPLLGKAGSLLLLFLLEMVFCVLPASADLFSRCRFPRLLASILLPFGLYLAPIAGIRSPHLFIPIVIALFLLLLVPGIRLVLAMLNSWDWEVSLAAFLRRLRVCLSVVAIFALLSSVSGSFPAWIANLSLRNPIHISTIPDTDQVGAPLEHLAPAHWDKLDREARLQVLYTVCVRQAEAWNIPTPKLDTARLNETTRGNYSFQQDRIRINKDFLAQCSSDQAVQTALHELRHAYQHWIVEAWHRDPVAYKEVESYARQLEDCFDSYIDGEQDYESYRAQFCEEDARDWSQRAADALFAALDL